MTNHPNPAANVKQAVPLFAVSNIDASVRYMRVTSQTDPDGYRLEFERRTDVPEETERSAPET